MSALRTLVAISLTIGISACGTYSSAPKKYPTQKPVTANGHMNFGALYYFDEVSTGRHMTDRQIFEEALANNCKKSPQDRICN